MEMTQRLWWRLLVLWLCARRALATNQLAVIVRDYDARTLTTERVAPASTEQSYRQSRWQREEDEARMAQEHEYQDELAEDQHHDEAQVDTKAMVEPKNDYWGGYYDFLINEGSYKFWAIFQLATAALLIYSGFAALYYAKVNPQYNDYDYGDLFARRRRKRFIGRLPRDRPFFGLRPQSLQRILDAVAGEAH